MAEGHGSLSSSIFINASQNSVYMADSLIYLIENDTMKIADDPDLINEPRNTPDKSEHRSKRCSPAVQMFSCSLTGKAMNFLKIVK